MSQASPWVSPLDITVSSLLFTEVIVREHMYITVISLPRMGSPTFSVHTIIYWTGHLHDIEGGGILICVQDQDELFKRSMTSYQNCRWCWKSCDSTERLREEGRALATVLSGTIRGLGRLLDRLCWQDVVQQESIQTALCWNDLLGGCYAPRHNKPHVYFPSAHFLLLIADMGSTFLLLHFLRPSCPRKTLSPHCLASPYT